MAAMAVMAAMAAMAAMAVVEVMGSDGLRDGSDAAIDIGDGAIWGGEWTEKEVVKETDLTQATADYAVSHGHDSGAEN